MPTTLGATTLGSVAALAAALALAATALPAKAATFVYVGCTDSNEIHVLQLDPQSGGLTPVEKVTIPGIAKTAGSTVDHVKKIVRCCRTS